ncbi:MAG: hypothetical protein HQL88_08445 [Magnetococcales bacterium]|nr:hypothetical protein [Magnetococcales bacterium]
MANIPAVITHLSDTTLSSLKEGLDRLAGGLKVRLPAGEGETEPSGERGEASLLVLGGRWSGERVPADLQTWNQTTLQVNDGIAMTQVASAGLDDIQADLQRLQKLVLASRNSLLSDEERLALQRQAELISHTIGQKVHSTRYNGLPLLASTKAILLQTGVEGHARTHLDLPDLSNAFASVDLRSSAGSDAAQLSLQKEQALVEMAQSRLASQQVELQDAVSTLDSRMLSRMGSSRSLTTPEEGESVARQIAALIRDQAVMAFQVQANQTASRVQQLI